MQDATAEPLGEFIGGLLELLVLYRSPLASLYDHWRPARESSSPKFPPEL